MTLRSLTLVGCLLLASCGRPAEPAPPKGPEEAALLLLRLSRDARSDEVWARVVDPAQVRQNPARFAAALASLRRMVEGSGGARLVRLESLGADRAVADLECDLAGGGKGFLAVQSTRLPDGSWRVVSIDGPDLSWPEARPATGEGLTTSSHR